MNESVVHTFCTSCAYRKSRKGLRSLAFCGVESKEDFNPRNGEDAPRPHEVVCNKCRNSFQTYVCPRCGDSLQRRGALVFGRTEGDA